METVIADAVDDAAFDATPSTENTVDVATDAPADPLSGDTAAPESLLTDPLAADPNTAAQDEFEKRWGIPSKSVTGRENRIPHSRVKQMITKAEAEAAARAKELEAKWAGERTPLETKVKDYEGRLEKVAQFEHVLENDPKTFLNLLSQLPNYKPFFDHINQLMQQGQQAPQAQQPYLDHTDMPQPDETLSDGSKVYSLEGLAKRDEWLARKIEEKAVHQAEERLSKRYQPLEQAYQERQRYDQIVPVIERQIAEARQWPNFQELEPEVIKLLKADNRLTLDRAYVQAYQQHIVPKLTADHNTVRTRVLAELKQKPVNSSAPVGAIKPNTQQTENLSPDDVIRKALRDAGLIQ